MFSSGFLLPVLLTFGSQFIIVASVFFMSGKIAPQLLSSVYDHTSLLSRTVITALTTMPLANYMISYAYQHFNPGLVTPINLTAVIIMQVVLTLAVLQLKPNPMLIPAVALIIVGALWSYHLLKA
jgi:drug/metabolite transporter (DMT)-like permease